MSFAVILVCILSVVFAHDGHDHDHDHDHDHHHHHHTSDHLQKISGNCDKLAPLVKVNPEQLNGKSWIVHNDSSIEDPDEVCETFSTRYEDGQLHTSENVQTKGGKSWNVRVVLKPDANREGYYLEEEGEVAVVLAADKNLDALCFAECGKLEGRDGYGAHVFCGTMNGKLTSEQLDLIDDALRRVRDEQGIDLPSYPLKVSCDTD